MKGKSVIRQRLTAVFVFLSIAPLLLVGLLLSWQIYTIQKSEAVELLKQVSMRVVAEITSVSGELASDLEGLVSISGLVYQDRVAQYRTLDQTLGMNFNQTKSIFDELSLLDAGGHETARLSRLKVYTDDELRNRSGEAVFRFPVNQRKIYYSSVKIDPLSKESVVEIAIPVEEKRSGQVNLVLTATVRVSHFFNTLFNQSISQKINMFISTDKGLIVSHDDPSIPLSGEAITVPVGNTIVKGTEGFRVLRLAEPFQLGEMKFYLVCDYHLHDAFYGVAKSIAIVGFFIVCFLAVSLLLVYRVVKPIVGNIEELGDVAVAVSKGHFNKKVHISGTDEIAVLGETMNLMTSRLVEDIERRKQVENELLVAKSSLEEKVRLRTAELLKLNERLRNEIDEKAIAETNLLHAQEELEERVERRTEELAITNSSLKAEIAERIRMEKKHDAMRVRALAQNKLATLGEVATGVAHEINQPLSYIKIIFEAAVRDLEKGDVDHGELLEECQESLRQVKRITAIIDHLRTFGRAEPLEVVPVNLKDIWKNATIIFGERVRLRNVSISEDFGEDIVISGSSLKLEQLFINLLQNALDALLPKRGGEISLSIHKKNEKVEILFSDTGIGMTEEVREKVFEPFYTTKAVGEGTGLGLSISYGIVMEHDGTIECQSSEGDSTTFTIRFPCYAENDDD